MSDPFFYVGWSFYWSICSHSFFQGFYGIENFWQQPLINNSYFFGGPFLRIQFFLRAIYLFNYSYYSHPSLEVLYLFCVLWQSRIIWSVLCRFHSLCHLLSFFVTQCHLLPLAVIRCHSLYHSLSLVVICCTTRCH